MSRKPRYPLDATQRLKLARTLDREIRELHQRSNASQAEIAERLARMDEERAYLSLGYSSVRDYAWKVIGWRAGKVKSLLKLLKRLPRQPLIAESFRSGAMDWTKAVLSSRGAEREPERESEWRDAGLALTSRQLELKLSGETGEPARSGFWLEATPEQRALLEEWLRALRTEGQRGLTLAEALVELVQRSLTGGGGGSSKFRVLLRQCPGCGEAGLVTRDGALPLAPERAEELARGAERYDASQQGARGDTQKIPKEVEDEVRARAGDRCEIPGCTIRDDLHFHHARGRGRGHAADEILLLCSGHHQAPHSGALRLRGERVSDGIEVTLADGRLLGTIGGGASREPASPVHGEEQVEEQGTASREPASPVPPARGHEREREAALAALRKLQLSAREAERLLRAAEEERPELASAPAEELVRAALRGA